MMLKEGSTEKVAGESGSPKDDISNEKHLDKSAEHKNLTESGRHKHKTKDHADDLTKALSESHSAPTSRRKHHSSAQDSVSTDSLNSSSHKSIGDSVRHSSSRHLKSGSSGEHGESKDHSLSESSSRRKHHGEGDHQVHKSLSESIKHRDHRHHLKSSSSEHERDKSDHKDKDHKHHKSSSNDHSTDSDRHLKASSDHSDRHLKGSSDHSSDRHLKASSDHSSDRHSHSHSEREESHRSHRGHDKEEGHSLKINIYSTSSHPHHQRQLHGSRSRDHIEPADSHSHHSHGFSSAGRLNKSNDAIPSGSVPVSKSPSPTSVHNVQNPFPEGSPREHRLHGSPLKRDDSLSHSKDKISKKERKDEDKEHLGSSRDKVAHHHITSGHHNAHNNISILLPPNKDQQLNKKVSKDNISGVANSANSNHTLITHIDLSQVDNGQHDIHAPSLSQSSHLIDPSLSTISSPVPTFNPSLSSSSLLKRDEPLNTSNERLNSQPNSPKINTFSNGFSQSHPNNLSPKKENTPILSPFVSPTGSPLSLSTLETEKPSNTPEEAISIATEVHSKFVKRKIGLNDFERLKLIGVGGIGHVYLVRLKGTQQLYAMKTCRKIDMEKQNKIKRALTEREVLATADHPFISTLYYSFQSSTQLCFIMQYCAGGEFYRVIQRQPMKCLIEEQVKFYASEVLLALEYLHLKGFIYRDLKPENILMHATGHVLLTDFDLSKHATNPVQPRIVTKMFSGNTGVVSEPDLITNSFVGTEEYLAPEVIKGVGHNATVDWWTFGILIYEMLYGVTPFKGKNQQETFLKIQKQPLVNFPPHPRGVQVTKTVKTLLKALLTVDNKKRLGTTGGATDIKDHPFFKDIKWQLLRQITPPIVPKLSDPLDTKYFKDQLDTWEWDEKEIDPTQLASNDKWKDFLDVDHGERDADGDFGIPTKNNFIQNPPK
jgi:protein-serine/threonine kinase